MTEKIWAAIIISIVIAGILTGAFLGCKSLPVDYEKKTGIIECDIAIMTAKIKSREGYAAFEVSSFINACFSAVARQSCKEENFKKDPITYDKKDDRYMNYLSCLAEKK